MTYHADRFQSVLHIDGLPQWYDFVPYHVVIPRLAEPAVWIFGTGQRCFDAHDIQLDYGPLDIIYRAMKICGVSKYEIDAVTDRAVTGFTGRPLTLSEPIGEITVKHNGEFFVDRVLRKLGFTGRSECL